MFLARQTRRATCGLGRFVVCGIPSGSHFPTVAHMAHHRPTPRWMACHCTGISATAAGYQPCRGLRHRASAAGSRPVSKPAGHSLDRFPECLKGLPGRSAASRAISKGAFFCTDLLPHNLPELMTGNVTIRKVKAHQDLQAVAMHDEPLNLMCAMGNSFADAAAKHARGQDLEIVQLTCQQVYDWYAIQQEALTMYSTFLLALAKIVVPLKQAYRRDLAPTGAVDETQQKATWAALQQPSTMVGHQIGLPQTFTAAGTGWPQWFVSALEHWTGSLRWPVVADRLERHAGITYLELLLNFAVCTGHLPPVRRLSASGTASWCNPLESDGILQPVVLRDCVVMLVTAVQVVKRHSKVDLWPSPRHHKLRTLEVLGYPQTKKGLLWRPLLHRAEQTGRLLVAVLASSQPGEDLRESLLRAAAS